MKNLFVVCVALLSSTAFASTGDTLSQFFHNLEARWSGKGTLHQLQADGTTRITGFRAELKVDRSSDEGVWETESKFELDTEVTSQNNAKYMVKGDRLFVSTNSQTEPVLVTESTPVSLTYFMRRSEVLTGRVYDFTFHYELGAALDSFTSHNIVQMNGVIISDEWTTARR